MSDAYLKKQGKEFCLGNASLARSISIDGKKLATTCFHNKLTGHQFKVRSREFLIKINRKTLLSNADFVVGKTELRNAPGRGKRLIVHLANREHALDLEVSYEVRPKDFYMRKQLRVKSKETLINEIHVECSQLSSATKCEMGGFGQPLLVDGELFLGLEYPAGYNRVHRKNGTVDLYHFPGRTGNVESKKAVFGVCPDTVNNRVRDWFLKYIDQNRARPIKRFFSEYCNMGGGRMPDGTPKDRTRDIRTWCFDAGQKTFRDQGVSIDCCMVNSNQFWLQPKSIMKELPEKEQAVPTRLIKKLAKAKLGAGVGMHLNTGGGRGSTDHQWLAENFDMIDSRYYCIADPRVHKELKNSLLHMLRKYGMNMFSFDWLWWKVAWDCGHSGHGGHITGVKYGREAITDNMIDIFQTLRRESPDIVLQDLEVELSPWWLFYAEALWSCAGEGVAMQHELIDGTMRSFMRTSVYPMSDIWYAVNGSLGTSGPIEKGAMDFRQFVDTLVMSYMRGSQIEEIYFTVGNFVAKERKVYAEVMKWGRARQDIILANTTYVLGNPNKLEIYGLTHFREDNRGVIGLHNPTRWKPASVRLKLDEKANFYQRDEQCTVEVVYPYRQTLPGLYGYGDTLELTVQGGETVMLETLPESSAANLGPPQLDPLSCPSNEQLVSGVTVARKPMKPRSKTWQTTVKFKLAIAKGEKVRLKAICDIDSKTDFLTEVEGLEIEKQLEAQEKTGTVMTSADKRTAIYLRQTGLFRERATTAVSYRLRQAGNSIAVARMLEPDTRRMSYLGRHPRRKARPLSRTWGISEELTSGSVELVANCTLPGGELNVWLEREIKVKGRRVAKNEAVPSSQWLGSRMLTLNILDVHMMSEESD